MVKDPPAMWETWIQSLGWEDSLEEGMATHSRILAWRTPMDKSLAGYSPWDCKRNKAKLHSVPSVLCWHAAYAEKGYWQIFKNISDRIEAIRIHRWFFYSCGREVAGTIHVGLVRVLSCVYRPHEL